MKTKNSRKLPSIRELFHKIAVFFHGLWRSMGLQELKRLRWQNFLLLIGAGCINAVGVTMFLAPVNLYDSGISGTSMLLWQATPPQYTLSLFLVVLNVPLFLFGLKKQD